MKICIQRHLTEFDDIEKALDNIEKAFNGIKKTFDTKTTHFFVRFLDCGILCVRFNIGKTNTKILKFV